MELISLTVEGRECVVLKTNERERLWPLSSIAAALQTSTRALQNVYHRHKNKFHPVYIADCSVDARRFLEEHREVLHIPAHTRLGAMLFFCSFERT